MQTVTPVTGTTTPTSVLSGSSVVSLVRYSNRKLYSPTDHGYVTLSAVRDLVKSDTPFTVTDHATGADITDQVLIQALTSTLTEYGLTNTRKNVLDLIKYT